ncbi:hypothetical protein [Martelella sp. FOR1707]
MARPKLGDTDTERMQLKITSAEIEAIDDWRFANRVPSRSEAVRRLCATAIVALNGLDSLNQMAEDASVSALDDHEHIGGIFRGLLQDAVEGQKRGLSHQEAKDLLHDLSDRAYWQEQNSRYINRIISGLNDAVKMYADPQAFSVAERQASERLKELDAFIDHQHREWDVMAAHHARTAVLRMMTEAERAELDATEDRDERIQFLDQQVAKYREKQRRHHNRLRKKIRAEDQKIRQKHFGEHMQDDYEDDK